MKLLVTGASGFLGRYIVEEAVRRGHRVRAVVRPGADAAALPWPDLADVELARVDLRSRRGLADAVAGTDLVIHAAAAKAGDLYAQLAGTVVATENLIAAMREAGVDRMVAVSSFAVYDYGRVHPFVRVDESTPVLADTSERDEYAQTKLLQEQMVVHQARDHGWSVTVIRPGVIYGPGNTWTARLGAGGPDSRTWLRIGGGARLPLTYVENCAQAIVLAAEHTTAAGAQIVNLVDDAPPTQRQYMRELLRRMPERPRVVPIPYLAMRALASLAVLVNRVALSGRAKLPGVLVPARVDARFKPFRYTNARAREVLGWQPRYSRQEALDRSFAQQRGAAPAASATAPAAPPIAMTAATPRDPGEALVEVGAR